MEIEVGKFYKTRCGYKVIIYAIYPEKKSYRNIHGAYMNEDVWVSQAWYPKGNFLTNEEHDFDIVSEWTEPHPAESWEVDKKILVHLYGDHWVKRYFAYYKDGLIFTFYNGATSWSEKNVTDWKYAKPAEEE